MTIRPSEESRSFCRRKSSCSGKKGEGRRSSKISNSGDART
jgi:hypothetical protein